MRKGNQAPPKYGAWGLARHRRIFFKFDAQVCTDLVWGFGATFGGYLATSGAKSDVMFFLGDPDFLHRGDEILLLSQSVFEI